MAVGRRGEGLVRLSLELSTSHARQSGSQWQLTDL